MTTQRLSRVTLGVRDVERSGRFYADVGFTRVGFTRVGFTRVGFTQSNEIRSGLTFESGGLLLALRPRDDLADEFGVAPQGSGFRGLLLTCRYDTAEEVDAAYEQWVGAGGIGVRQPADRQVGGRAAIVADPDAHLWELCTAAPLPEHASVDDTTAQQASTDPPASVWPVW